MNTLTLLVARATVSAAAGDGGDVASAGWISGTALVAIISAIFGGGGLVYGGWKGRQAEAERRRIEGEIKANLPNPLPVELQKQYVSKETFLTHCNRIDQALKDHIADNERNFEAIYNLVRANDKLTATIAGTLEAIKGDLALIKDKLFRSKR